LGLCLCRVGWSRRTLWVGRSRTAPCAVRNVNLTGVFLCCRHGIPHLPAAGGGSADDTDSFVAVMGAATSRITAAYVTPL
jgi:hypothetical protein